ncbi:MAG: helix-turn-helix domain-containing protein, partial [Flavobacteriales bacterium]
MSYVFKLIEQGEHQQQDFKTKIADSKKISRTLSAFANSDGGRLLIGVKDNGSISGVDPQEEFHMIEAAAEMYCDPPISFTTQVWKANFRSVLQVDIESSANRPHY